MRISDLLRHRSLVSPHAIAYRYWEGGRWESMTWKETLFFAESAALSLRRRFAPGSRIGVVLPNGIEWILTDLAFQMADLVPVSIQGGLPAALIAEQLEHAQVAGAWPESVRFARTAAAGSDPELAVIVYTSGTSGSPKGAMLSHEALIRNARTVQSVLPFAKNGTVLNWLPLSHIYARNSDMLQCMVSGTTLALCRNPTTVLEDLAAIRPTNMHGVPYFYEKVLRDVGPGGLREAFGGNIDWIKAGGAPLPAAVARAYRDAGLLLLQGYGTTEAAPVIASSTRTAHRPGTVGKLLPGVEARIDPTTRELSVRTPSLFSGYWREPERTAEVVRDGWLATGDMAEMSDDGFLTILGRSCETIVLSTGRKLQPSSIEGLLVDIDGLEAAFVSGTGKPWPVALLWTADTEARPRIEAEVRSRCESLPSWERIRRMAWFEDAPTAKTGEWTTSRKWKRAIVEARYRHRLDGLYE